MRIAIIMPSKGRQMQLERNVTALIKQRLPRGVEALVVALCVEVGDIQSLSVARRLQRLSAFESVMISMVYREDGTTCVQGFNQGYAELRGVAEWYVLGSDDQIYGDGWLEEALEVAEATGADVVGLNDGHTNLEHYAPHFMMRGAFIEDVLGGFMVPPAYKTWWFDREICERAQAAGRYAPAWKAMVEHRHPDWGTAEEDNTHLLMKSVRDADKALYLRYREEHYA